VGQVLHQVRGTRRTGGGRQVKLRGAGHSHQALGVSPVLPAVQGTRTGVGTTTTTTTTAAAAAAAALYTLAPPMRAPFSTRE